MQSQTIGKVRVVGNYQLTGRLLGKGHFARVEEAQHKILGKKVALKIIDVELVHEDYVKRNLHREARVMSCLRHPCIAMLYETIMSGTRFFIVMEAVNGGDLYSYVLATSKSRSPANGSRGIHEECARSIATQLVSAVNHMHSCKVVHRDLKMENIMLDQTKQNIKIVDFGLSNMFSKEGGLSTPCGSLEYAAPELFVAGNKYGPEVDLWSLGVIVYGMLTGSLPFHAATTNTGEGELRQRPLLQRSITKGFGTKQKVALTHATSDCRAFIQLLLQPNVELRMTITEACRHSWIRKGGRMMNPNPYPPLKPSSLKIIYKNIGSIYGLSVDDVEKKVKTKPYGEIGGYVNIKVHHHLLLRTAGKDSLWASVTTKSEAPNIITYAMHTPYKNLNGVILNPQSLLRPVQKYDEEKRIKTAEKRTKRSETNNSRPNTCSYSTNVECSKALLCSLKVKPTKVEDLQKEKKKKMTMRPSRVIKSAGMTSKFLTKGDDNALRIHAALLMLLSRFNRQDLSEGRLSDNDEALP